MSTPSATRTSGGKEQVEARSGTEGSLETLYAKTSKHYGASLLPGGLSEEVALIAAGEHRGCLFAVSAGDPSGDWSQTHTIARVAASNRGKGLLLVEPKRRVRTGENEKPDDTFHRCFSVERSTWTGDDITSDPGFRERLVVLSSSLGKGDFASRLLHGLTRHFRLIANAKGVLLACNWVIDDPDQLSAIIEACLASSNLLDRRGDRDLYRP